MTQAADTPANAPSPGGGDAPTLDRDTVVVEWPRPPRVAWLGPPLGILAVVAVGVAGVVYDASGSALPALGVGGCLVFVMVGLLWLAHWSDRRVWRRMRDAFDEAVAARERVEAETDFNWEHVEGAPSRAEIISAILHKHVTDIHTAFDRKGGMDDTFADVTRLRLRVPRVIVDRRVAGRLQAAPMTPNLLEPEAVASRWESTTFYFDFILIVIAIAVFVRCPASPVRFVMPLALLAPLVLRRFGMIRRFFRHGVSLGRCGAVAGTGYLEWPDGSRVGSWQAVTLLSQGWLEPLTVRICAPDRVEILYFSSCQDPGFVAFWQRWNHPHPRPELLESKAR